MGNVISSVASPDSPAIDLYHPDSPQSWIRTRYLAFDGLRGLAVLAVFLRHYAVPIWPGVGLESLWVGVDLFFVLSGFLITGILFDSRMERHFFSTFYVRRALRIFPIFYALFAVLTLLRFSHVARGSTLVYSYALYLGNLTLPFLYESRSHNPTVVELGFAGYAFSVSIAHLWSLCVEEHFYLIWPLIVRRVPSRPMLMRVALLGIAATLLLRIGIFTSFPYLRHHGFVYAVTFTRWDELMIGAALALYLRCACFTKSSLRRASACAIGVCCVVLAVGLHFTLSRWPDGASNPFIGTIGYDLIGVAAAGVLLLSLDDSNTFSTAMRWKPLATLGRVSYGFYVIQGIGQVPLRNFLAHAPKPLAIAALVGLFFAAWALAGVSFRYLESPFLRLKDRVAPASHPSVPGVAQTGP